MAREGAADAPSILHLDEDLCVVLKPPRLATTAPSGPCLASWVATTLGRPAHPTSRLDADVTGLVTFARTKSAIHALRRARTRGAYGRGYLALLHPPPASGEGVWDRAIAISPRDRRLRVAVDPGAKGERVQLARSLYRVRAETHGVALAWLTPHTGRTHQLRVHAADAGAPILGDTRYGGLPRLVLANGRVVSARRPMLHCAWLSLSLGADPLVLEAPPPADLRAVWSAVGGEEAALAPRPD